MGAFFISIRHSIHVDQLHLYKHKINVTVYIKRTKGGYL